MRIIYMSRFATIISYFFAWAAIQSFAGYIAFRIPDRFFNPCSFLYRTRKWEKQGKVYETIFKIKTWKKLLPDGGNFFKGGFAKKKLISSKPEYIEKFIIETCRAELTHWLAIAPFWVFGLWSDVSVIKYMFIYAVGANMPCILAQRYNRPRLQKLLKRQNDLPSSA